MKNKPPVSKEFQDLKNSIEKQLIHKLPANKPATASNNQNNNNNNLKSFSPLNQSSLKSPQNTTATTTPSSTPTPASKIQLGSLDSLGNNLNSELSSNMSSFSTSSMDEHRASKKPPPKFKPKLIDLEFKNELEKLFSSNNHHQPGELRPASRAVSSSRINSSEFNKESGQNYDLAQRTFHKSSDQILNDSANNKCQQQQESFEQKKSILDGLIQNRLAKINGGIPPPPPPMPPLMPSSQFQLQNKTCNSNSIKYLNARNY